MGDRKMWNGLNWKNWRIAAKLDPDKKLRENTLQTIIDAGFDALIVGGTQGINSDNTDGLINLIREANYPGPLVHEITVPGVVAQNVDAYFLPVVLNAGDVKWITGLHHRAIKHYAGRIPWDRTLAEGYVICNPACAAGIMTRVNSVKTPDATAYCDIAEKILGLPVIYLEYSGTFGDPALVEAVARRRESIHVFYGGGIDSETRALAMSRLADTVIVGNVIYDNPAAIGDIVKAVRATGSPGRR
ncbi:heptaprenylglyceryl phosphate synthase [Desulfoscipio geothermicus]|uniref:Putative glycerol-1-phosphate prenyltransferase n=1 Tax=Desulfoscipio geothermicus DSM 3669 TaxID=1121426 RepID=A0A1I6DV00_9FIRM|nr:heptaprenylglyceryl phosphate synthase [Desulfoscipio geothermicus]SFR09324.1 putative glycerol-1-phosphate prenyltransferase [Desulfoscipio geothermicus DSM 3669]